MDSALNDEDEGSLFAYNYRGDFPEALNLMAKAMLGGRPVNSTLGPLQQIKMLAKAAEYRAPTPRRPGKGKTLPASEYEGEKEVESRKAAQKACQRLIVPKPKSEKTDAYMRRLDAHRNAPEALIAPMSADETELQFAKRCIAIKGNEHPNQLILPKSAKETDAEFEERLEKAKQVAAMIFPRGVNETDIQWKHRAACAVQCKVPIMPRSEEEPEIKFDERCKLQAKCDCVIHPFDEEREDEKAFTRRLQAHKERVGAPFEPGDTKAINAVLGAPQKAVEKIENAVELEHVDGAQLMAKQMQEVEELKKKEEEEAARQQEEEEEERRAAEEEAEAQARVEAKLAQIKLEQVRAEWWKVTMFLTVSCPNDRAFTPFSHLAPVF